MENTRDLSEDCPPQSGAPKANPPELPIEMWDRILDDVPPCYLPVCTMVCRDWTALAKRLVACKYAGFLKREARSKQNKRFLNPRADGALTPFKDSIAITHFLVLLRYAVVPFYPYHIASDGHLDLLKWVFGNFIARVSPADSPLPPAQPRTSPQPPGNDDDDDDNAVAATANACPPYFFDFGPHPNYTAPRTEGDVVTAAEDLRCVNDRAASPPKLCAPYFVHAAAKGSSIACLEWLISEGVPPGNALRVAASNGKEEAMRWLADSGYVLDEIEEEPPLGLGKSGRIDAVAASLWEGHAEMAKWCFHRGLFEWEPGLEWRWARLASVAGSFESISWLAESLLIDPLGCHGSSDVEYLRKVVDGFGCPGAGTDRDPAQGETPGLETRTSDNGGGDGGGGDDNNQSYENADDGREIRTPPLVCAFAAGTARLPSMEGAHTFKFIESALKQAVACDRLDTVEWIIDSLKPFRRLTDPAVLPRFLVSNHIPMCILRGHNAIASRLLQICLKHIRSRGASAERCRIDPSHSRDQRKESREECWTRRTR